ncbi:hypothetical protein PILCRDRAFT_291247 [Piloderma croceum F 1598]|uniref:Uncharacterized protein n=1 Tax=Piloderma croceum (strain F 1598) TaxID=765440 RepID=A0A0C3BKH1_PILCF|nr:hypothetical protein PILCRDRAFT_291247 [Piloderma croceum F 1598]
MGDFGRYGLLQSSRRLVIDWKLVKPGAARLDIGQFCAEMHLLRPFSPACDTSVTTALDAFLKMQLDAGVAKDAMVHVGDHLVAWTPRVPCGCKERTRGVAVEGVGYLVAGTQE